MLVKGHRDTLARTAHCNTAVNLALLNTLGKSMAEVRIVNRSIAPCAIVPDLPQGEEFFIAIEE